MSRSVRRCGRYGAAEKGAKIRGRWGCAAAAKAGRCAEQAQKSGDCAGDCLRSAKARRTGDCAADVSAVRGLGNVDAVGGQSARSTRQERPAGKLLFALLLPEASGATFRGISGLGDMAPRLSFSPGGGAPSRQNLGLGERGVRSVRKERKLGAPEAPRFGWRGCRAGPGAAGRVSPEGGRPAEG